MKDLIEYIAKSLVDAPNLVEISEVGDDETSTIKLTAAKDDLGKIIGKKGRTAKAIRIIMAAAAQKTSKRSTLDIIE